jgi:predicted extracellular nuclease
MRWLRASIASLLAHCLLGVATAQAQVVLNEVDYDQPGTDAAEFIELRNVGTTSVNLGGFQIQLINGANGGAVAYSPLVSLPAFDLPAGEYFVVCANALLTPNCDLDVAPDTNLIQNGAPDAIALLAAGVVVDAISYEGNVPGFTEINGAPADDGINATDGLSRCPDGADTGDNSLDFLVRVITPGGANDCPNPGGGFGACGDPATLISAVQGSGATTPLAGSTVVVEGIVVGDFQDGNLNGFFLQEEDADADADPATSEGIFVFEAGLDVPVLENDRVRVRGMAGEFSSQTQLSAVTDIAVCANPGVASAQTVTLPVAAVGDLERFEGMRAQLPGPLTVTGNFELGRFGSLDLSVGGRLFNPTQLAMPGMAAIMLQDLNNRSRIVLDDASNVQNPNPIPYKDASNTRRLGDTLASLAGVLSGSFGAYRIQPTVPLASLAFQAGNPRPPAPEAVSGRVRVATANVLNYFTTLDMGMPVCGPTGGLDCRGANTPAEFTRQRDKILNELVGLNADIYALIEIENNATAATGDLVAGLNDRLGAGTYSFVDTGTIGTDAIKLALLYRPAVVRPVGPFAILNSAVDPRFIDTKNRPSLAQTFEEVATGARFTVIDNHLKSKGSACTDVGDPDTGGGAGNCNGTRNLAAMALLDWIVTDPTGSGDPDFLVLGDFNAYAMEDPIRTLVSGGLVPLVDQNIGSGAYSFQFQGQSGYLDHAFATSTLASQITGITEWHVNADEPVVLDYNQEFKTDDPYSGTDPFKASDHDPLLVGIALTVPAPVVPTCLGFQASVYVSAGTIVGGPDAGLMYAGVLRGSGKADILVGTSGNDQITGRGAADLVCGGGGDDLLIGSDGADLLFGEAGNDELQGKAGRDSLSGGPGTDVCRGGDGVDRQDGSCETALNIP